MTIIAPATPELLQRCRETRWPTLHAGICSIEEDGQVSGVCGLVQSQGRFWLFATLTSESRRPRTIARGLRELKSILEGRVIYALADPDVEGSERVVQHLGFEPYDLERRVYRRAP